MIGFTAPSGNKVKYIETMFLLGRYYNEAYNVDSGRNIYDPKNLGDQHLLSGSGFYSTGWHMTISVSLNASGSSGNIGNTTVNPAMAIAWIE